MNTAVKTHWRLAYKSVKRAIKVTLISIESYIRAYKYSTKVSEDLYRKRKAIEYFEE
jgi:hypothetical protein